MKIYQADTSSMFVEVGDTVEAGTTENSWGYIDVKVIQIIKADFRSETLWFYGCETRELEPRE